jgi:DinB superfamily
MHIDFARLTSEPEHASEYGAQFTLDDLRTATNSYLDTVRDLVEEFGDAQLIFEPSDPKANDTYAKTEAEVSMGWSLAHLVLHVTASLEEGATICSLLARGIQFEGRFRYEPGWRDVTTRDQVLHRIEESRRMCLAYLDTWPDEPHLDNYRKYASTSRFANAKVDARASFLLSLSHMAGHLDQFREVAEQVRSAAQTVA